MEDIKEQVQEDIDSVAVELLKGEYTLTEYTRSQQFGYIPTREYAITTNSGVELSIVVNVRGGACEC